MKRILTSLGAGVALAAAGLSAHAANFTANDAEIDATYYFSGATASAQFIRNALIQNACKAVSASGKDVTVFEVDKDDWVLVCEVLPAIGTQTIRVIKQGGGSGDGTTPIAQPAASPLDYPVPAIGFDGTTDCTGVAQATTTGAGNPFILFDGCTIPNVTVNGGDIGTSDVEPKLFFDLNTPSTGIAFTPADNAVLSTKALAGLGFGIGVTTSLRNALQALQFPATSSCHPSNADHSVVMAAPGIDIDVDGDGTNDATVDVANVGVGAFNAAPVRSPSDGIATVGDSEPCMPNLTSAEVTGLASGKILDWIEVQRGGTTLVAAATAAGIAVPTSSAVPGFNNRRVHFCRRNEGSGTQAQFNAHFFTAPCTKIGTTELWEAPSNAGSNNCTFTATSMTCNNRGSSDLGRCLNAFETGGTGGNTALPFDDLDANPFNNNRYAWAFGLQSVEKNPNLGRAWRFVKVDGLAPTVENVYAGDYTDHYEQTCQRRSDNSTIDANGDATTLLNLFNNVCTGGPVDIFKANLSFLHPWGKAGWLTVPDLDKTAAGIAEAPASPATLMDPAGPVPVSSWTRRGESCTAPVVYDSFQSSLEGDLP